MDHFPIRPNANVKELSVVITHIFYARQSQRESKTSATDFTNFLGLGFKNPRTLVKFAAKCF